MIASRCAQQQNAGAALRCHDRGAMELNRINFRTELDLFNNYGYYSTHTSGGAPYGQRSRQCRVRTATANVAFSTTLVDAAARDIDRETT
jgi:hypothetical protein